MRAILLLFVATLVTAAGCAPDGYYDPYGRYYDPSGRFYDPFGAQASRRGAQPPPQVPDIPAGK